MPAPVGPRYTALAPNPRAILDLLYRLLFVGSLCSWLAMTGWLLEREILPRYLAEEAGEGYERILGDVEGPVETRMSILAYDPANDRLDKIGSTVSRIEPQPDGSHLLTEESRFDLARIKGPIAQMFQLGSAGEIPVEMRIDLRVDAAFELVEMSFEFHVFELTVRQFGFVEDGVLHLRTDIAGQVDTKEVDASDHPLFAGQTSPFRMPRDLSVGQTWRETRVDPLTGGRTIYEAEVLRVQDYNWEGEILRVFVVEIHDTERKSHLTSLVDDTGRILEQQLPMNLILRLEKPLR